MAKPTKTDIISVNRAVKINNVFLLIKKRSQMPA